MATITVNRNTNHQTMIGWETASNIGQLEFPASFPNWDTEIIAELAGIGINRVRTEILSGWTENSTDYWGNFFAENTDVVDNSTPTSWATARANRRIPVNDNADANSINASGFKWTYLDRQVDTIINPLKTALAANGETLFWSVCYVHFSTSNQLHVDSPAEYGELILAAWQHLDAAYGFVPDALEIFLEPDNVSCQVSASEIAAMIQAARDRLVNAGFAKPYIIAPSMTIGQNAESYYDALKTANATAAGYIDEISYHRYGTEPITTELASLRTAAEADSKNTAMSEYIGADIFDLYDDLTFGKVSAWTQYIGAYPDWADGGTFDTGAQYFLIESGTYNVIKGNRTKYLEHFFKYIRRGAVGKGVTNSDGNILGLPFENANGKYVVVGKCAGGATVDVEGLPAGTYSIRYTLGDGVSAPSAYDQALSDQTINEGQDVSFSMPGAGVFTVFDVDYLENAAVPPQIKGGGFFAL